MTKAPERLRIVRVDWLDAQGGARAGWRELADVAQQRPVKAVSFGLIVRETRSQITVLPHAHGTEEGLQPAGLYGDGEITIPKRWVMGITEYGWLE